MTLLTSHWPISSRSGNIVSNNLGSLSSSLARRTDADVVTRLARLTWRRNMRMLFTTGLALVSRMLMTFQKCASSPGFSSHFGGNQIAVYEPS